MNSEVLADAVRLGRMVQVGSTMVCNIGINMTGRLHLDWAGKDSIPRVETRLLLTESIYPDGLQDSENIMIQGDNLLALKALSATHRGIVKQIVIDPPTT